MRMEHGLWMALSRQSRFSQGKRAVQTAGIMKTAAGNIMKTAASSGMHGSTPAETGIIFSGNGNMATGLIYVSGDRYYLNSDGSLRMDSFEENGIYYQTDSNGKNCQ